MNHIDHIIDELCEFDPKLEKKRPELKKMVAEILKAKPHTKFDEAFKKKLYHQLLEKTSGSETKPYFFNFFMKPLPSLFSGLVMGAVLMFATTQYLPLYTQPVAVTPGTDETQESLISSYGQRDLYINSRGPGAFGSLNVSGTSGARGQGGGGGGDAVATQESKMMIAPDGPWVPPVQYQYNYSGELTLSTEPIEVLKRIRGKSLLQNIPSSIQQMTSHLIDLSAFSNMKLNSLDVLQESNNGFTININFSEGMVSIFKQYEYRPYVEGQQPPTFSVPPQDTLFAMATDFLKVHNVNLENYGSPELNDYWTRFPENPAPQQITIVYPLVINGKTVYDQGGSKFGISVNIDLAEKEVVSVWNIRTNQFESSPYPAVADKEKLIALMKKGGMFYEWYGAEAKETVSLELGEPQEALMNFYKFDEKTGQSEEILVPALVFTVTSEHKDPMNHPRQNVIVPLAKEILDEMEKQMPMPLDLVR